MTTNRATSRKIDGIRLRQVPSGAPWNRVAFSPTAPAPAPRSRTPSRRCGPAVASAGHLVALTSRMQQRPERQDVVAQQADRPGQRAVRRTQCVAKLGEHHQADRQSDRDADGPVEPRRCRGRFSLLPLRQPPDRLLGCRRRRSSRPAGENCRLSRIGVVHPRGDVDAGLRRTALHLVGQIDRGAPHVVGQVDRPTRPLVTVPVSMPARSCS